MNRKERREFMKKHPAYRKSVKKNAENALNELEKVFQKRWEKDDQTLNQGKIVVQEDDNDEKYKY